MRLRISSRKSDLARIQAYAVGRALKEKHPKLEIEYRFRESLGDIHLNDPLWKMPERGVFTNDFYEELSLGETDLVVHSWKDLPTEERADTEILATLPRADSRDVLLLKKTSFDRLRKGSELRIYSSSPRRAYNLENFLKSHLPFRVETVTFESVRGNVPTRVRKLHSDEKIDGLIVAKAALDRLLEASEQDYPEREAFAATARELRANLDLCRIAVLPLSLNPTAAAQGALAVEVKRGREDLRKLFSSVHCARTFEAVQMERAILKSHGGGCHQKIGVSILPYDFGNVVFLQGLTDLGVKLAEAKVARLRVALPREKVWPRLGEDAPNFFDRHALSVSPSEVSSRAWFVARANALPENWNVDAEQIVWAAGTETWKKLAARGIWVNGTADGLGEEAEPDFSVLVGRRLEWVKLTHDASPAGRMPQLATYALRPRTSAPDLSGREHFFWMSGSSFLQALQLNPGLRDAQHYCGPGNTYRQIRETLGPSGKIQIELSYESWAARWESRKS